MSTTAEIAAPIMEGFAQWRPARTRSGSGNSGRRKTKPRETTRSGLPTTCGVKTQWGYCAAHTKDGMCERHYREFLRKQSH